MTQKGDRRGPSRRARSRLLQGFASGVLTVAAGLAVVTMLPPAALAAAGPGNPSRAGSGSAAPGAHSLVPASTAGWIATYYVPASATGWYTEKGEHPGTGGAALNYLAGINPSYGLRYRDFFVFSLAGITAPVCAATMDAGSNGGNPPGGTYSLRPVTTLIPQLTANHGSGDPAGLAIYADLGDGPVYGSVALSDTQVRENSVSVPFNSEGVAAVNAALGSGSFAVGGDFASTGEIFAGTPAGLQQLTLATCSGLAGARVTLAGLHQVAQGIGLGSSLSSKVAQARAQLAAGHITAARNTLAAFIHEVRAQAGKAINEDKASELLTIANRARALLG